MAYPDDFQLKAALRGHAAWLRNYQRDSKAYIKPAITPELLDQAADRLDDLTREKDGK